MPGTRLQWHATGRLCVMRVSTRPPAQSTTPRRVSAPLRSSAVPRSLPAHARTGRGRHSTAATGSRDRGSPLLLSACRCTHICPLEALRGPWCDCRYVCGSVLGGESAGAAWHWQLGMRTMRTRHPRIIPRATHIPRSLLDTMARRSDHADIDAGICPV